MQKVTLQPLKNFQILQKLGEGSYAQVYKVLRISDNQIYAMKKVKMNSLKEKDRENALNEVRILASYDDPYIIGYKEAFLDEESQVLCIIMEFASDGDLQQMIKASIKKGILIKENIIWKALYQMTRGLKRLHDMKIVHRDLKCANIFISDGVFKLGDLNVSKVAKKGFVYTQTGTPCKKYQLSVVYASPEVWRDEPYDMRSDIWSLGCVVYEMATHTPPFHANDMQGLFKKIQRGYFDDIPRTYSKDLQTILSLMIQVQPSKRSTCQQLLNHPLLKRHLSDQILTDSSYVDNEELLKTIQLPKNLKSLMGFLPQSKYQNDKLDRSFQLSQQQKDDTKLHPLQRFQSAAPSILRPMVKNHLSPLPTNYKRSLKSAITPHHNQLSEQKQNDQSLNSQLKKQDALISQSSPILKVSILNTIKKQNISKLQPLQQPVQLIQTKQLVSVKSNALENVQPFRLKDSPKKSVDSNSDRIPEVELVENVSKISLLSSSPNRKLNYNQLPKFMDSKLQESNQDLNNKPFGQLIADQLSRYNPMSVQSIINKPVLKIEDNPFPSRSKVFDKKISEDNPFPSRAKVFDKKISEDNPFPSRAKVFKKKLNIKPQSANSIKGGSERLAPIINQYKSEMKVQPLFSLQDEKPLQPVRKILFKDRPESAFTGLQENLSRLKDKYQHYYPISQQQESHLENMRKDIIKTDKKTLDPIPLKAKLHRNINSSQLQRQSTEQALQNYRSLGIN